MAFQFYVTIEGARQGTFQGDPAAKEGTGAVSKAGGVNPARITALAFNYGVTTARDAASGQASGKRQHSPVSFVKEWDAASPQLFQACCTNEVLSSVLFEFVEADAQGNEQVSHSIKLTNATIASMKFDVQGPAPSAGGTTQDLEEIAMVFQKIDIVGGGKTASDLWSPVVASRVVTAGSTPLATTPPHAVTVGGAAPIKVGGATQIGGATQTAPISPALGMVVTCGRLAGLNRSPQQDAASKDF